MTTQAGEIGNVIRANGQSESIVKNCPLRFPLYLMRGEVIQIDGKFYTIPEPVACDNPKQLFTFLYERQVQPAKLG